MVKSILVSLLCLPLVLIGWRESEKLVEAWRLQAPAYPAGDAAKIESLKTRANETQVAFAPVRKLVVALDEPAAESGSTPPARALAELTRTRKTLRKVVDEARKDEDVANVRIRDLIKALAPEGEPRTEPSDDLKALERKTAEYRKAPLHDESLARSAALLTGWIGLRQRHPDKDLEDLEQRLGRWTPKAVPPGAPELDPLVKDFRAFLDPYDADDPRPPPGGDGLLDTGALVREARERALRWELAVRLARALPRGTDEDRAAWPQRARQIVKVADEAAALIDRAGPDPRTADALRQTVRPPYRALCQALVPAEPPDDQVIFAGDDQPHARDAVEVWLNGDAKPRKLADSGRDEFNLKSDQLKDITVDGETYPPAGDQPLKPTPYSLAVRKFNERRAEVRDWDQADVENLLTVCQASRRVLEQEGGPGKSGTDLIPRLEELKKIVDGHPAVFAATP